ncbi:ubiquitin carboxyl-terminal hydrolase [Cystoisospora suis]|uniref:ubiquitinyl hydrolase 1 n=1 Tax=Cystoisospora suis TaxID=483139 RepID=A0A2C6KBK5_9APIC|nr:ubiquitin carboxyl-terminal hydrolase [Cystoisospora suis]
MENGVRRMRTSALRKNSQPAKEETVWGAFLMPFPVALWTSWLKELETQRQVTEKFLPLPLHNPSSFCFLSASLQALASLSPLLELLHLLAYLHLLQKGVEGTAASTPDVSPFCDLVWGPSLYCHTSLYSAKRLYSECQGQSPLVQGTTLAGFRRLVFSTEERPHAGLEPRLRRPMCGAAIRQASCPAPRAFVHTLYKCLLTLNAGIPAVSASFLEAPKTPFTLSGILGKAAGEGEFQACSDQHMLGRAGDETWCDKGSQHSECGSLSQEDALWPSSGTKGKTTQSLLSVLRQLELGLKQAGPRAVNSAASDGVLCNSGMACRPERDLQHDDTLALSRSYGLTRGRHSPTEEEAKCIPTAAREEHKHDEPRGSWWTAEACMDRQASPGSSSPGIFKGTTEFIQTETANECLWSQFHVGPVEPGGAGVLEVLKALGEASSASSSSLRWERRRIVWERERSEWKRLQGIAGAIHRQLESSINQHLPGSRKDAAGGHSSIKEQDAHELLQVLLQELEEDCHAAEELQFRLLERLQAAFVQDRYSPKNRSSVPENYLHRLTGKKSVDPVVESEDSRKLQPRCSVLPQSDPSTISLDRNQAQRQAVTSHGARLGNDRVSRKHQSDVSVGSEADVPPLRGRENVLGELGIDRNRSKVDTGFQTGQPMWSVTRSSKLKGVFSGRVTLCTYCLHCGVGTPERSEPFSCLQLSLAELLSAHWGAAMPRRVMLEELLQSSFSPESVDDVICLHCSAVQTTEDVRRELERDILLSAARRSSPGSCLLASCPHLPVSKGQAGLEPSSEVVGLSTLGSKARSTATAQYAESKETGNPLSTCDVFSSRLKEPRLFESMKAAFGLYSPLWLLPGCLVRRYVHRWAILSRLQEYTFRVQGGREQSRRLLPLRSSVKGETRKSLGWISGRDLACDAARTDLRCAGDAVNLRQLSDDDERELEALSDEAGDLWMTVRRPKVIFRQLRQLPEALVIQVNSLTLGPYGEVRKCQQRCSFPLLLNMGSFVNCSSEGNSVEGRPPRQRPSQAPLSSLGSCHFEESSEAARSGSSCFGPARNPARDRGQLAVSKTDAEAGNGTRLDSLMSELDNLYELRAVVSHLGTSASTGHFVCYRRWDARAFMPSPGLRLLCHEFFANATTPYPLASPSFCTTSAENSRVFLARGARTSEPPVHSGGSESHVVHGEAKSCDPSSSLVSDVKDDWAPGGGVCSYASRGREKDARTLADGDIPTATTSSEVPSTHGEACRREVAGEGIRGAAAECVRDRLKLWLSQSTLSGASTASFVCASDASVRPVTMEEVMESQPYLLFYQRTTPMIL